tara:strand:+ start:434 stop:700 length:267 start_codon:yes stop_codon:yes gene_type:complete
VPLCLRGKNNLINKILFHDTLAQAKSRRKQSRKSITALLAAKHLTAEQLVNKPPGNLRKQQNFGSLVAQIFCIRVYLRPSAILNTLVL